MIRMNKKNTANREPNLTTKRKSYPCLVSKISWLPIVVMKFEIGYLDKYYIYLIKHPVSNGQPH